MQILKKRALQGLIFPEGIYIENEKLRTAKMSAIFRVLSKNFN